MGRGSKFNPINNIKPAAQSTQFLTKLHQKIGQIVPQVFAAWQA
jgi:hypothetical protein